MAKISKKLFTVDDYHRMVAAGILREDDRVELIRGEVLQMSPIGPPHNGTILRASHGMWEIVKNRALVGVQGSIRLDMYSEPQPDLYLLRPVADFYTSRLAGPPDIFLIIEVADSSLEYDQDAMLLLYAQTGIPEYWISDIAGERVIAYSDLEAGVYRTVREFRRGEVLAPQLLPDCRIPIEILLP
ncbi:MAG TPA: Uma2 family endonuclease [Terriglobia bacterium]|jgi:hypothetical protein